MIQFRPDPSSHYGCKTHKCSHNDIVYYTALKPDYGKYTVYLYHASATVAGVLNTYSLDVDVPSDWQHTVAKLFSSLLGVNMQVGVIKESGFTLVEASDEN